MAEALSLSRRVRGGGVGRCIVIVPTASDDVPVPAGFPDGFGTGDGSARALLVLVSLRGITPERCTRLAWAEGTASSCLDGHPTADAAGSENDQAFARTADPSAHRRTAPRRWVPGS